MEEKDTVDGVIIGIKDKDSVKKELRETHKKAHYFSGGMNWSTIKKNIY